MTITECAAQTGVGAHTLRHYERIGVLDAPQRRGGIRRYDATDVRAIRWIKRAKRAELRLDEIATLAERRAHGDDSRERTATLVRRLLALRAREAELAEALAAARSLATECSQELQTLLALDGSVVP